MISQIAISSIHEVPRRSIDDRVSLPQFDIYVDSFMDIPLVVVVGGNKVERVLKLNKSRYELKKSSANWFDLIIDGLESRGCHQYQVNQCGFYIKDSFLSTYVVDCVIVPHKKETIISLIKSL